MNDTDKKHLEEVEAIHAEQARWGIADDDCSRCFLLRLLKESLERESASAYRLSILLAVIHGDGGHYESAHGTEKASTDAETVVCALHRNLDALQYRESRVMELHREIQPPKHYGLGKLCNGCDGDWPCSTIRILDGGEK